ncbi:hypothetical protein GH714_029915 [Hevea brasiliensis]|uniref:Uncharacterized protein n=1 Tax=Hevea brasiliensis TaxID=3981 RepID=A0A6A6L4H3_HEVBR|nr:hypothetical protein GH714_029915 [Hevea brasiliensis]
MGSFKDYIREYSSLMLEIPDMPDKSRLLYFLDGLQRDKLRKKSQRRVTMAKVGETSLTRQPSLLSQRRSSRGSRDRSKPKNDYFIYGGPHWVRECPNRAKLNAIASAYEGMSQEGEAAQLGMLRVLNDVQAKVATGETTKARPIPKLQPGKALLFVGAKVNGVDTKALLDSGANQNLVLVEEATRLGLKVTKEPESMKVVDQPAKPLFGVAHGVPLQLGNWAGTVDLSMVPLKDFQLVIRLDFMERVLPFSLTEDGCMTFRSASQDYTVAVE